MGKKKLVVYSLVPQSNHPKPSPTHQYRDRASARRGRILLITVCNPEQISKTGTTTEHNVPNVPDDVLAVDAFDAPGARRGCRGKTALRRSRRTNKLDMRIDV